mgnify:CR=1 FL=1
MNLTNKQNQKKMKHRPKRENYSVGIYGDIEYDEKIEKYCTYLEKINKELRDYIDNKLKPKEDERK